MIDPVNDKCQNHRVKNFRNDDSGEIIHKAKPSPQQKRKCINRKAVKQICNGNQGHRNLDIIIVIDPAGITGQKTNIHIDQSIKSKQ